MDRVHRTRLLIVGSGANAISAAIHLQESGVDDFLLISKHADFGGCWYQNTYPGAGVDDTIYSYQLPFAFRQDWTHRHATQPQLLRYFQQIAREHGLYERTHFATEMLETQWLDAEHCWSVATTGPTYQADVLVLVTGFLDEPQYPEIPGSDRFTGRIFHASAWPDGYTGAGDRVAIVGTGSSGIEIAPSIHDVAQAVTVFQRTATHVLPKGDRPLTDRERAELSDLPERFHALRRELREDADDQWQLILLGEGDDAVYDRLAAEAQSFLEREISDPALRAALTPDHAFGCRRLGRSDDYYACLNAPNVELVAEAAAEIGPTTITSAGGRTFAVDTIVLATGFHWGAHVLTRIRRRDGRTVAQAQEGHSRSYKASSVSGCPNLFLIGGAGPNGQIWDGLACGTAGARYLVRTLEHMRAHGIRALEVREEAETAWKRAADAVFAGTVKVAEKCSTYSKDGTGHNRAAWPGGLADYEQALSEFDAADYDVVARG